MAEWFVTRDGAERGPLSSRKLRSLAGSGDLNPDDLVRRSDRDRPVRAGSVAGLFDGSENGPPPLPSARRAVPPPLPPGGPVEPPPLPNAVPPVGADSGRPADAGGTSGKGLWSRTWPVLAVIIPLLGAGAKLAKRAGWLDRPDVRQERAAEEPQPVSARDLRRQIRQESNRSRSARPATVGNEAERGEVARFASRFGWGEANEIVGWQERLEAAFAEIDALDYALLEGELVAPGTDGHRQAVERLRGAYMDLDEIIAESRARQSRLGIDDRRLSDVHDIFGESLPEILSLLEGASAAESAADAEELLVLYEEAEWGLVETAELFMQHQN